MLLHHYSFFQNLHPQKIKVLLQLHHVRAGQQSKAALFHLLFLYHLNNHALLKFLAFLNGYFVLLKIFHLLHHLNIHLLLLLLVHQVMMTMGLWKMKVKVYNIVICHFVLQIIMHFHLPKIIISIDFRFFWINWILYIRLILQKNLNKKYQQFQKKTF